MTPALNTCAAVAVVALIVGAASGAWVSGTRWESRYHAREVAMMQANQEALEKAKSDAKIISDAADAIRRAPVRRVFCTSAPAASVSGNRDDAGGIGGGTLPADRDSGAAMRDALMLEARVRRYNDVVAREKAR